MTDDDDTVIVFLPLVVFTGMVHEFTNAVSASCNSSKLSALAYNTNVLMWPVKPRFGNLTVPIAKPFDIRQLNALRSFVGVRVSLIKQDE